MDLEPIAKGVRADFLAQSQELPDVSHSTIANQLFVAVGTLYCHIKRMLEKGHVKVKRAQR